MTWDGLKDSDIGGFEIGEANAMGLLESLLSKDNPPTASQLVISAFLMKRTPVKLRPKCESHSEARSKKYS